MDSKKKAVGGWETVSLGRVAQITMGQSPDSKYYSEEENGLPFLQGCAEFKGRFPKNSLYCSETRKIANSGSILFSVRAPVGRINIADRDYLIGRGLAAIAGKEIEQSYLEHYLTFVETKFRNSSQGSTFEAINSSELIGWPIECPTSKPEQAKIAEILSTVDRAIEQTETLIAKQRRIKTGLMQDLLTRGIDEHGNLRTEQTHKFKDSPLGRIPIEWKVGDLGPLAEKITKGESPGWQGFQYQPEGVLFITSENVRNGFLDIKTNKKYIPLSFHEKIKRSTLKKGDILINLVGASIARTAIFDCEETSNINQAVCLLRLGELISSGWFSFYLQMSNNVSRLLGEQVETARANLSLSDTRNFVITIPKIEEQRVVESIILSQDQVIEELLHTLEKARALKTSLMQDLLTGTKRVTALLEKEASTT